MSEETFKDRRKNADRRQHQISRLIPSGRCRRMEDRRQVRNQFDSKPWWLRTNYVEDIGTPTLVSSKEFMADVAARAAKARKARMQAKNNSETLPPEKKQK